jgi:hypothetical protein
MTHLLLFRVLHYVFWVHIRRLLQQGLLEGCEQGDVLAAEFSTAQEVLSFGGGHCTPIVEVNGEKIGKGEPGPGKCIVCYTTVMAVYFVVYIH